MDIKSFVAITGPKTDIRLVRTVAALLLAISVSFIVALAARDHDKSVMCLAISCRIVLIIVDCCYALSEIISKIYLADALLEIILLVLWLIVILRLRNKQKSH